MNIEKNHPIPLHRGPGKKSKWPFSEMEIGESFFASWVDKYGENPEPAFKAAWQSNMGANANRHKPMRFTTKVDHAGQGVRVWRVA